VSDHSPFDEHAVALGKDASVVIYKTHATEQPVIQRTLRTAGVDLAVEVSNCIVVCLFILFSFVTGGCCCRRCTRTKDC
jgi:hypothetical protein